MSALARPIAAGGIALAAIGAAGACRGERAPDVKSLPAIDPMPPFASRRARPPSIASYRLEARLDAPAHRITGREVLAWVNDGKSPVSSLPFHLYMNAFKNEGTVFMRESIGRHRRAHASRSAWGWIDVSSIRIDGGPEVVSQATFPGGADETVMELPLARPVAPGGRVEVAMAFEVQLPRVFARTGYAGPFTMVGQWFPKIGVRVGPPGQEHWSCDVFHLNSEFFADFGDYDVVLTVPDTEMVAATGVLVAAADNRDATRTLRYRAESVHDFAWMADPTMQWISATARTGEGTVEVRVYFRPDQRDFARRHLAAGVAAIEGFSRMLVPYPWARMTIVDPPPEADAGAGGMEYPTFVTTGSDWALFPDGVRYPEYVTIHEVGHNWLQGILASNEVDEAWLDEGVNDYVDTVLMGAVYGERTSVASWGPLHGALDAVRTALHGLYASEPDPVATRSYDFVDTPSYGRITYSKTRAALLTLQRTVGSQRFLAAMKKYAEEYAFRHPTEADLVRVLERELGDLDWFLRPALHEIGAADLRVRSVVCRPVGEARGVFGRGAQRVVRDADPPSGAPERCEVIIENLGRIPVPVEVEVTTTAGRRIRQTWDDRGAGARWHRFTIDASDPIARVVIDPDQRVALDDGHLHRTYLVQPDLRAPADLAAREQFATQTAMQILGL